MKEQISPFMKEDKMVCNCCGKVIYNNYTVGGYQDHLLNFVYLKDDCGKRIEHDVQMICINSNYTNGGRIREIEDIRERLNCYLKWDNISDEFKNAVYEKCNLLIDQINNAKDKAEKTIANCSMLEMKFLLEEIDNERQKYYKSECDMFLKIIKGN